MHPKNIYKNGIDFAEIYKSTPESREHLYLTSEGHTKMLTNRAAEMFITKFLLKRNVQNSIDTDFFEIFNFFELELEILI